MKLVVGVFFPSFPSQFFFLPAVVHVSYNHGIYTIIPYTYTFVAGCLLIINLVLVTILITGSRDEFNLVTNIIVCLPVWLAFSSYKFIWRKKKVCLVFQTLLFSCVAFSFLSFYFRVVAFSVTAVCKQQQKTIEEAAKRKNRKCLMGLSYHFIDNYVLICLIIFGLI